MDRRTISLVISLMTGGAMACCMPAPAQTTDSVRTAETHEIIVTATRIGKSTAEAGRSTTVLTGGQIGNSLGVTAAGLLSRQAGISLVGIDQNPGATQTLFMRGASAQHTVVMIDGVRIADPSAITNAFDLSELSLAGIDRIEIVRGSHSTLYGSSAIGGVVSLTTFGGGAPGLRAKAEITTGTFGKETAQLSENVSVGYTDTLGWYVYGEVNHSDVEGLDATVDTSQSAAFRSRDRDGWNRLDLLGKIGFVGNSFDAYTSYKKTRMHTDIDKAAYRDDDNYALDFDRHLYTFGGAYRPADAIAIQYIGGVTHMTRRSVDDSTVVDAAGTYDHTFYSGTFRGGTQTHELQTTLRMPNVAVVFGGGWYGETMTFKTYYYSGGPFGPYESTVDLDTLGLRQSNASVFVHTDIQGGLVGDRWRNLALVLGARLNNHSAYGGNLTFEITPTLKPGENTLLYASYSTGFNAPSLYQLHAPDRNAVSGVQRGNRHLRPETSSSYEIGIKQNFGTGDISLSYYTTVVDDLIEYVYLWESTTPVDSLGFADSRGETYLNIGRQINTGIEVSVNIDISDRLLLAGNISLMSGRLSYRPDHINAEQTGGEHVQIVGNGAFLDRTVETIGLVRRPGTANVRLAYTPLPGLELNAAVKYVGPKNDVYYNSALGPYGATALRGVAEYTVVDIGARYDFSEHSAAILAIENIVNTGYTEINGYTTRGRGIFLRARYGLHTTW